MTCRPSYQTMNKWVWTSVGAIYLQQVFNLQGPRLVELATAKESIGP
jgi:hypothetical protein